MKYTFRSRNRKRRRKEKNWEKWSNKKRRKKEKEIEHIVYAEGKKIAIYIMTFIQLRKKIKNEEIVKKKNTKLEWKRRNKESMI